ncbi:MAG: DNA repair protein RecN [Desulfobulbaceae bacterium]|nr:MAG: DNA repair protein RecN [Desulfobulbaceae bacterium]
MLVELRVENLALIESLHLNFDRTAGHSLVAMTGETGAGKSIMLRAITLLSGRRASPEWIRSGESSCAVEALFEIDEDYVDLVSILANGGFDTGPEVVIKRVLNEGGRSRYYINGSLATAKVVSEICEHLLTIASQHDHQRLLQPSLHLDFLDSLGDLLGERATFGKSFSEWNETKQQLETLRTRERDREQRLDFLAYQVKEIREAALSSGEDQSLAEERTRLKNSDALIKIGRETLSTLGGRVSDDLAHARKNLEALAQMDGGIQSFAEEFSSYAYLIEDHTATLRDYCDGLETDPARLEAVVERLDLIQSLKRKYGDSIEAILEFAAHAETELKQIENLDREIMALQERVQTLGEQVLKQARNLSERRQQTARRFEQSMGTELSSLAFDQARIEVRFAEDPEPAIKEHGADRVEFFFAPNPGEPARPLAKIASGGELSRLMLALKCLFAKKDRVETVIFDEVDAGIGGEAAEAVARKIQELAGHHQVFCITHLPQIAARGTEHLLVQKGMKNGRTQSEVSKLEPGERVDEIARMLAGSSVNRQAEAWAKELLNKGGQL